MRSRSVTSAGGAIPVELKALETAEHTGVFVGCFFPVEGAPERASEIQVEEDDTVTIAYFDAENTDPGIGWTREAVIEQAWRQTPELRVYDVESREMTAILTEGLAETATWAKGKDARERAIRALTAKRLAEQSEAESATAMLGGSVLVELLWPTVSRRTPKRRQAAALQSLRSTPDSKEPYFHHKLALPNRPDKTAMIPTPNSAQSKPLAGRRRLFSYERLIPAALCLPPGVLASALLSFAADVYYVHYPRLLEDYPELIGAFPAAGTPLVWTVLAFASAACGAIFFAAAIIGLFRRSRALRLLRKGYVAGYVWFACYRYAVFSITGRIEASGIEDVGGAQVRMACKSSIGAMTISGRPPASRCCWWPWTTWRG